MNTYIKPTGVFNSIYENEDQFTSKLLDLYNYYSDQKPISFDTSNEIVNELINLKTRKSDFIEENELDVLMSQLLFFFGIRSVKSY
jgi:hypothetical protein